MPPFEDTIPFELYSVCDAAILDKVLLFVPIRRGDFRREVRPCVEDTKAICCIALAGS